MSAARARRPGWSREETKERVLHATRDARENRKGWARAACPFCPERTGKADRKESFGFNAGTGWYECYRCGASGRLPGYGGPGGGLAIDREASPDDGPDGVPPPEGYRPLALPEVQASRVFQPALRYLREGRRLTDDQIARFQIGACMRGWFAGRVIVPVFAGDGSWAWYVGRLWHKLHPKPYRYPSGNRGGVMFNHEALFEETDEPALIMEGCFDAIPYYPDAAADLGTPTDHRKFLAARRPVVFVLDGDAHDKGWRHAVQLRMDGRRAGSVILPAGVDPDEVPTEQVRDAARRSLLAPGAEARL